MGFLSYKKKVEDIFVKNNIDKSEVNILFCETLNLSLDKLLLKTEITNSEKLKLNRYIKKRLSGEPIQKIFRRAYFFEYQFYINNNVLCPRPETELLVEECIKYTSEQTKVLDLCTGSGAIAVTIQKKTNAKVTASDISKKALYVARKNAKVLGTNVKFVQSDMFDRIDAKFDLIVSNPPYIPTAEIQHLDREVRNYDPTISLDGGISGLEFYKIIANNAKDYLNKNGKVLLEVGKGQAKTVAKMFTEQGFTTYVKKDYNNIDRIVVATMLEN